MPIHPDQRARYPANWKAISAAIRARAGGLCEQCDVPDRAWGWRDEAGTFHQLEEELFRDQGLRPPIRFTPIGEHAPVRVIEIVLTVAHLDHRPENNDPANLQALCQRCHLNHDRPHHRAIAEQRRHMAMATAELPLPATATGDQHHG